METQHCQAGEGAMAAEGGSAQAPSAAAAAGTGPGAEGVDDEPRLKYQRLGSSCSEVLQNAAASCMAVEDKLLALGTQQGVVHVIDYNGNEVTCRLEALAS